MSHEIAVIDDIFGRRLGVETQMSFNFDKYDRVVHLMHGHQGKTVAKITRKIIVNLTTEGIVPGIPDTFGEEWRKGLRDGKPMSEAEKKGVYLCHVMKFFTLAMDYPYQRFYSYQVSKFTPFDEDGYHSDGKDYYVDQG